jgi:hypothetical protein
VAVEVSAGPGAGEGTPLDLDGLAGEARAWVEKA